MHDIWNPWHGCKKCSEGCQNCYMYYLDFLRDKDGSEIYRTKAGFKYPLSKYRDGTYKVKSGEMIRVCMTSDSFLEEADIWRDEAEAIIKQRSDVKFFLLTKRPERVADPKTRSALTVSALSKVFSGAGAVTKARSTAERHIPATASRISVRIR